MPPAGARNAVARVWIKPGKGEITVNGKRVGPYFARPVLRMLLTQPFLVADRYNQFDVVCTVTGGGLSGQAGAVRHGISRALTYYEPELRGDPEGRRLPHPRHARGRAQEVRQGEGPPELPVQQALILPAARRGAGRYQQTSSRGSAFAPRVPTIEHGQADHHPGSLCGAEGAMPQRLEASCRTNSIEVVTKFRRQNRPTSSRPNFAQSTTEAKIGCDVLNRMTKLGMPASVRIL